ncbi:hypothetical protein MSAN_02256500 [Mycena sanguinolenta]|uniref:Uncharacterized protein n=1 Tax=Mycena sanguinolenta TaxID=230812 RepID=A0A8H6XA72_9AGAR|nr:hypothetical protein MSAN_02256500 [Mycena sanguinolenta]
MSKDHEYQPLFNDTRELLNEADVDAPSLQPTRIRKFSAWIMHHALAVLLVTETVALVALVVVLLRRTSQAGRGMPLGSQKVLYSPALSAVEHEVRVYHLGFPGDLSPFQIPSSPELDQMWSDLYNCKRLRACPIKPTRFPETQGTTSIAELDVFHNIHCLNKVRMASLDPDYYPDWRISTSNNYIPTQKDATEHIPHCIDWLRQSIMCHVDTSVIVWQWNS